MYWCLTGWSGTLMPAIAPTCRAHCPAQFTTFSQATVPRSVSTATMRPLLHPEAGDGGPLP
jgi:hypothetical protein